MAYFTVEDHASILEKTEISAQSTREKLLQIHRNIYPQLRRQNLDLHLPESLRQKVITDNSVTTTTVSDTFAVQYTRGNDQATVVERLMGREEVASVSSLDIRLHPVIEYRLMPEAFAIELVLSPAAWWDQRNLVGKISILRHRIDFYSVLRSLDRRFRMGFWRGIHLSDMHIRGEIFHSRQLMDEWLSTFEPGKDLFRVGIWYEIGDEELESDLIQAEIIKQVRALYNVYEHIRWSSDNNFVEFYST